MAILKHYGKYGARPCIIVYREVPGLEDYCLIVDVSTLDGTKQDAFLNIVNSREGQAASELNEVLARSTFSDGSSMLRDLHFGKKLQKVAVDMVEVTPNNSQSMPLRELNVALKQLKTGNPLPNTDPSHLKKLNSAEGTPGPQRAINTQNVEQELGVRDGYDKHSDGPIFDSDAGMNNARIDANQSVSSEDPATNTDIARGLITQALLMMDEGNLLQQEAKAKLEKAYSLDPSLRPMVDTIRSPVTETSE